MANLIPPENSPFNLPGAFVCSSPEETFLLGKRFARLLAEGSVVALRGPLGAGKTCFAKGIAKGLGVAEEVTSPTYTIVSEYEGFLAGKTVPVFHIDAYRLDGDDDFSAVGGEDIVFGGGISVIEWSERIPGFILSGAFRVDIEIKEDGKRLVRIYPGAGQCRPRDRCYAPDIEGGEDIDETVGTQRALNGYGAREKHGGA